jgi:hypothetical protein
MSNGAAFLTGFLESVSEGISSRKGEAKRFLDEQSTRARKIAETQLEPRRNAERALRQSALTLHKTASMPMHIVRGLIESGPEAINSALELYQRVPQHEWSASDWENIYETSEFYAREFNEDLNTLIRRTVGLIGDNYRATEQAGGGDLNSAFVASALGTNAMDRARSSLSEERIGGLTKQELLDIGDRPLYSVNADSGFAGPNMRAFGEIESANTPAERMSESQIRSWMGQFNVDVDREIPLVRADWKASGMAEADRLEKEGDIAGATKLRDFYSRDTNLNEAAAAMFARERVAQNYSQFLPPDMFAQMGFVRQYLPVEAPEQPVETQSAPVGMSMGEPVDAPVAPLPEAPSVGSFEPEPPTDPYQAMMQGADQMPEPKNQLGDLLSQFSDAISRGGVSDQVRTGNEGLSEQGVDTSRVRRFFENTFGRIGDAFSGRGGASDTRR